MIADPKRHLKDTCKEKSYLCNDKSYTGEKVYIRNKNNHTYVVFCGEICGVHMRVHTGDKTIPMR